MKINGENLLDVFRLLHLSLGTINARRNLLSIVCGLLRYFKRNLRDSGLLIKPHWATTRTDSIIVHLTCKKLSPIKNPRQ